MLTEDRWPSRQSALYERLFLLNQCLEQAAEIVEQLEGDALIHPEYAEHRKRALEELRSDLSHILTGLLHQRELEASVGVVPKADRTGAPGCNLSRKLSRRQISRPARAILSLWRLIEGFSVLAFFVAM